MKTLRAALVLCSVFLLAGGFWAMLPSAVLGREAAPADLITKQLPGKKTLETASKSEFLGAVCTAVRKHRSAVASITQAAVTARHQSAGEIVGMVLRCTGKLKCELVGTVSAAATAAEGDPVAIADAAMAKAPNCAETIREATRSAVKGNERPGPGAGPEQTPLVGTANGPDEGFDPHEQLNPVCDGGTQRAVRTSQLEEFLASHPGAFAGPCQTPTPTPTPASR